MIAAIAHLGLLDDEEIDLDIAALELSALDHEGVNLDPYRAMLDGFEAALRDIADDAGTGEAQAVALATVLAGSNGLTGDRDSYDAPLNADMIRVLDRRKGLPVSLSILYVAMARRVGWTADALNTPGHVLVRLGPPETAVVVDPFHDGAIVSDEGLINLVRGSAGPDARAEEHAAPMSNRLVLVRLLLNQATRAEQAGDKGRALVLYMRMVEVAPSNGQGWWDLARLQLAAGRVEEARTSLSAMLEITRDSGSRAHITAALGALSGR